MIWFKRKDNDEQTPSYFQRLKAGLAKTRGVLGSLWGQNKAVDETLLEDLEMELLRADMGMETTTALIATLRDGMRAGTLKTSAEAREALETALLAQLEPRARPLDLSGHSPFVLLVVGVNGAGKTTTIGKLARWYQAQGKKVMLAAGDTFRAAAVEQLKSWGERQHIPVIAQGTGADSASVAYDALESARAKKADLLIIDTAGRLHTQDHLMEELRKIKRVLQKLDPSAPHETMLVLDAGNGQNALRQAECFHQAMALSGLSITKLDGTAKGGIVLALSQKLALPIRFIGVGEKAEDLQVFDANNFVRALLDPEAEQ